MILFLLFGNIWCRGVVIAVHFQSKFGRKTGKTPHVALMSHPSTTTIYFGTDNFTTTYSTSTGLHLDAQLFNQFTEGLFMSFTFHSLNSWQGDQELRMYTLFTSHAGQYRTTCRCSIIHRLFSARHAFLCPYEPQK